MIQEIKSLDLKRKELEAGRIFSLTHDLWIKDHKPFKFMKHSLVSGIMAIETFLEAAHLLYPHLSILGVRNVEYKDILECPPGIDREARIVSHRLNQTPEELICQISLSSLDISPSGRRLDRFSVNYQGQVILGGQREQMVEWPDFPIKQEELDSKPMPHDEVVKWYENRTALKGRYRVIEELDGTGPGLVKGSSVYREGKDFEGISRVQYRFSPYLLEALLHLVSLYVVMRDEKEVRNLIPAGIGEMLSCRRCRPGERITLEARLRLQDDRGLTWNARATDETGITIMQAVDIRMNWFSQ
jgi:hypothetical protein